MLLFYERSRLFSKLYNEAPVIIRESVHAPATMQPHTVACYDAYVLKARLKNMGGALVEI